MNMTRELATGRAKCRICGKKITKGLKVMRASGYQSTGYAHLTSCDDIGILAEMVKEK